MIKQSSTRTNQGGSILIFTIVAVVLALALVGSVLYIRHKGEVAQTQAPIMGPIAAPPAETPTDGTEGRKSQEGAKDGSSPSENRPESNDVSQNSPAANGSSNNSPDVASELPQTGPADAMSGALVVALVTMVSVGYIRSRHLSWQL